MNRIADYIVVGAGTAGCAAADALTRDGRVRVTLVEAGGAPASPFVSIPAAFNKLFRGKLDWNYATEPEGAAGRSIYVPRGRMLGGSSNLNAQIHQWGHPADFDGWMEAGASGWGWSEIAPVLRQLESLAGAGPGRGADGPLRVEPLRNHNRLTPAFVAAAREPHQPASYNGGDYAGAWLSETSHHRGRRFSAWDGLLKPAMRRANLDVVTGALADAIVFEGRRAIGLRVLKDGRKLPLKAGRGVIVCAGAFGSPLLLMRSGIGPAQHLIENGIAVVSDLPGVGENLHDHPMACPTFQTPNRDTLRSAESPANLLRYIFSHKGPLASNVAEAVAFGRSAPGLPAPDLEWLFAPVEWREQGLAPPQHHAFTIATILLTPKSRGSVRLRDAHPATQPHIRFGLLSDREGEDRRIMIAGLRRARSIARHPALANSMTTELAPGDAAQTDAQLNNWLDANLQTVYHPGGTCRMGADDGAVADARLAVRGLSSLWVADASVMPTMVRGHPNHAVAMIGARAAEFAHAA